MLLSVQSTNTIKPSENLIQIIDLTDSL